MNKEKTLEQLEIARQIIKDGLEWECFRHNNWFPATGNPVSCVAGSDEIRIKPQPDKFAELKKAHAEGKTIQWKYSYQDEDKWQTVFEPSWLDRYEYRIKPEPEKWEELKKAHKEGKEIQYYDTFAKKWFTTHSPSFVHGDFRLKPEPVKVPLGPDDVPPGSVFRANDQPNTKFWTVTQVWDKGFYLRGENVPWDFAMNRMEINRSIPLTGKWNPTAWEPCYKEVEQ